jgi:hypothetical protein
VTVLEAELSSTKSELSKSESELSEERTTSAALRTANTKLAADYEVRSSVGCGATSWVCGCGDCQLHRVQHSAWT